MPSKVVDLSARSKHIREEPWHLHFWEVSPKEAVAYLRDPRGFLGAMGIELPADCRIETVITNHDWLSQAAVVPARAARWGRMRRGLLCGSRALVAQSVRTVCAHDLRTPQ